MHTCRLLRERLDHAMDDRYQLDGGRITAVAAAVGYVGKANPLWVFGIAAITGGIGLI